MTTPSLITLTMEGKVAILTMNDGNEVSKNSHNLDFATQLLSLLEEVEANNDVKSLILTSDDSKNWSQGVDVPWFLGKVQTQDFAPVRECLHTMDKVFVKLLTFPVPVIAAINGHTFGNGAVLASACDFRMMRKDRGYFCFPEVDIGIPFLPGMIDMITKAIPTKAFSQMILTGKKYTAEEMYELGAIEALSDNDETLKADALAFAKSFNKKRPIFTDCKRKLYGEIADNIQTLNEPVIESNRFVLS